MDVNLDADREWWLVDRETGELYLVLVDRSNGAVRREADSGKPASWMEYVGDLTRVGLGDGARAADAFAAVEDAAKQLRPDLEERMRSYRGKR